MLAEFKFPNPHQWGLGKSNLQDMAVGFLVFASIIVAKNIKLMLADGFNATCGGIFWLIGYNTPKCCSIGKPSTLRGLFFRRACSPAVRWDKGNLNSSGITFSIKKI